MAGITETLRLVFAADSEGFERGIGATLAQVEILRGALLDMTAPINQLQDEMIDLASEFESSIANVNTLLGDDPKLLEGYKNGLIELSTEIPQSAAELSDALYQTISAGIDTGKALDFVAAAGKAATAGMTSTYVAVDGATSVMNAFNISADKSNEVFDYMFQAVRDGKVTFEQLSSQMGMLAPTAAAAGIELQQMMAAVSTATGKLRPEQAFTGLAGAISELNTPASKASKALKRMGYDSLQAALKEKTLQQIMVDLVNSGQKIDAIFGREAARAVNAVGGSAEKAATHLEHMNEAVGATDTAFEKVNNTFENSQQHLENVRNAVKISIGKSMMPILTDWNNVQASILTQLSKMPPKMKGVAGVSLLMARGLSGVVNFGGSAARNLVALQQSVSMLKTPLAIMHSKMGDLQGSIGGFANKAQEAISGTKGLSTALGAAGLAAAIAFTTMELIKLYGAVKEYKAALKSLNNTQDQYLASVRAQAEADKNIDRTLSKHTAALDEYATAHGAAKKFIERELLAIGIDVKNLSQEEIAALSARGKAYRQHISDINAAAEAAKKAAGAEGGVTKALTPQEQLDALIAKLRAYNITFKTTGDIAKDLERAEKMLSKAQEKAHQQRVKEQAERVKTLKKYRDQYLSAEQQMWLKAAEGSEEYYDMMGEFEEARWQRELAQLKEQSAALKAKFGENSAEYKTQQEIIDAREMAHWQKMDEIETAGYNAKEDRRIADTKKAEEQAAKQKAIDDQRLADTKALYGDLITAGMGFFDAMGKAAAGDKDAFKNALKELLMQTLSFLEKKFILAEAASFIDAIFNPVGAIKNVPLLIAAEGAITAGRAMVASFDTSGMPATAGYGFVSPGDVILNPNSSEMGVLNALAGQIAEQMNARPFQAKLYLDGRQIAENNVKHVRRMNSALPKGRTVFDE